MFILLYLKVYFNETLVSMSSPHRARFVSMIRRVSFEDNAYKTYLPALENTYKRERHLDDLDHTEHRKESSTYVNDDGTPKVLHFLGPLTMDISNINTFIPK